MNKINLALAASLLTIGTAHASPCDGFEIKVLNKLSDEMIIKTIRLDGGEIAPNNTQQLKQNTEESFIITNVSKNGNQEGELIFNTVSYPVREVRIEFGFYDSGLECKYSDSVSGSDVVVTKSGYPGKVHYTFARE